MRENAIVKSSTLTDLGGYLIQAMRRECIAFLFVLAELATAAAARTDIICTIREVVIEEGPGQGSSSAREKGLSFRLDDASKTVTLADGTPLIVNRYDDNWISAKHAGVSYEFDRRRSSLSYASSTQRDRVTTLIVGSGRCQSGPPPP